MKVVYLVLLIFNLVYLNVQYSKSVFRGRGRRNEGAYLFPKGAKFFLQKLFLLLKIKVATLKQWWSGADSIYEFLLLCNHIFFPQGSVLWLRV